MTIPNMGLNAEQAEALFNFANNGVLDRVDECGQRCDDLYQWGLHPHTAEPGSALTADDAALNRRTRLHWRGRGPSPTRQNT